MTTKKRIDLSQLKITPPELNLPSNKITLPDNQFPAASLSAWANILKETDIPMIDVNVVAEVDVMSMMSFDETDPKKVTEKMISDFKLLKETNDNLKDGDMLRWDTCAPLSLKSFMAHPKETKYLHNSAQQTLSQSIPKEDLMLTPDDPRAFDILYEHMESAVKLIQRPLVEPMKLNNYPAEFRVFIKDNKVQGVSNYYLQMDMPEKDYLIAYAEQSKEYAEQLIKQCRALNKFPVNNEAHIGNDDFMKQEQVTATLDFMVTEGGVLTFIEAGPGYGFGAHPCCFYDKDTNKVSPIEGIKLGVKSEPIPFSEELMDMRP